jgi:hypothetical protein
MNTDQRRHGWTSIWNATDEHGSKKPRMTWMKKATDEHGSTRIEKARINTVANQTVSFRVFSVAKLTVWLGGR